ncbi:hypothetical protein HWV07_14650 [Natronomonas salina]|uniref:hypothetical protein n=1 Tax=Natronomonas salina TaxID=1710540 RepID=UPI0015B734FF|nr:hypothetical protein [Natronomonas salina]QLD90205.1 hypothetical protein HWV07_14650 [Natronomonas salina]
MDQQPSIDYTAEDGDTGILTEAYRHDVHKFLGTPHDDAPKLFAGVPANQPVPFGADSDAASLSRPDGNPSPTVDNHETHYRLSLVDGESRCDSDRFGRERIEQAVQSLVTESDAEALHEAWLTSDVASAFNESVYYPYTSLKYHTLLVAALVDNYRRGYEFDDLSLVVDPPDAIVQYRTIYRGERFALRITASPGRRPSARLGSRPWRSWATTWSRLTAHPLEVAHSRYDRVLDSNLRRIGAWSTALQYIEDFQGAYDQ